MAVDASDIIMWVSTFAMRPTKLKAHVTRYSTLFEMTLVIAVQVVNSHFKIAPHLLRFIRATDSQSTPI